MSINYRLDLHLIKIGETMEQIQAITLGFLLIKRPTSLNIFFKLHQTTTMAFKRTVIKTFMYCFYVQKTVSIHHRSDDIIKFHFSKLNNMSMNETKNTKIILIGAVLQVREWFSYPKS